jgi:predicted small metal-binding protein
MMKRRTRRDFRLLAYAPKLGSYCCTGQTDVKIQKSSVPQSHVQAITVLQSLNREERSSRMINMAITEPEPHSNQKLSFRCSDVGPKNCDWQVTASSEAEIMPKIEQHDREKHNMRIDDETRKKVHNAIQRKAA